MTRWRVNYNATSTKSPFKYWAPDVNYNPKSRPIGGKGHWAGTLQQPAEYLAREGYEYAREKYGREYRYKKYHVVNQVS